MPRGHTKSGKPCRIPDPNSRRSVMLAAIFGGDIPNLKKLVPKEELIARRMLMTSKAIDAKDAYDGRFADGRFHQNFCILLRYFCGSKYKLYG